MHLNLWQNDIDIHKANAAVTVQVYWDFLLRKHIPHIHVQIPAIIYMDCARIWISIVNFHYNGMSVWGFIASSFLCVIVSNDEFIVVRGDSHTLRPAGQFCLSLTLVGFKFLLHLGFVGRRKTLCEDAVGLPGGSAAR